MNRKYIIVLGDGMADEPIEALGGKTPLAYAATPAMDELGKCSEIGMVHTIPAGMKPGSDTANLSVLGYDPEKYYSGRSPLEALSIGVPMKDTDIALRCNIVTISEEDVPFEERTIIDHSSGEISTEDCAVLLEAVKKELENETYRFYAGTSYRHCLIWDKGEVVELTPPHDVLTQTIGQYLPEDETLASMMRRSYDILVNHPINIERKKQGMMVSAVDLLKGIAIGAGMGVAHVEGANGGLHTNYAGKTQAALDALLNDGYDFAYIHLEAPDEMGHQGSAERKVQAIEYLDGKVVAPLQKALEQAGVSYRMLILPDHPTPVRVRTHTSDSVPYMLYDSSNKLDKTWNYNEKEAEQSGNFYAKGHTLIDHLFEV